MKQLIKGYSHSIEDTHVQVGQVRSHRILLWLAALLYEKKTLPPKVFAFVVALQSQFLLYFVYLYEEYYFIKNISYYYLEPESRTEILSVLLHDEINV